MKIAAHPARHRRLAGPAGLSLLFHLLVLAATQGWLAPARPPLAREPISVKLAAIPPSPAPKPAAPAAPAARPRAPTLAPASAQTGAPAVSRPAPEAQAIPDAGTGTPAPSLPGRYQARPPPSASLSYAMTRTRPGGAAEQAEAAQLVWRFDGGNYRLRVDGVLGQLESEGGDDEAGLAPSQSSERSDTGGEVAIRFNRETQRIESGSSQASAALHLGSQDRASVLMQLASIGLADPAQLRGIVTIVVGGAGGAQIVRFQVLGREQLASATGPLEAMRMVQLAGVGEPRFELWLAPQHHWLPVQLRVTEPDGTVANQLVSSIEAPGQPPAID